MRKSAIFIMLEAKYRKTELPTFPTSLHFLSDVNNVGHLLKKNGRFRAHFFQFRIVSSELTFYEVLRGNAVLGDDANIVHTVRQ